MPTPCDKHARRPDTARTEEYWANVSETAKDFVRECLTIDPTSRPTAEEALRHKWLASTEPHGVQDESGNMTNLLPQIQKGFDARKTCTSPHRVRVRLILTSPRAVRKAVFSMMAMKRMSMMAGQLSPTARALGDNLQQYKDESEKVRVLPRCLSCGPLTRLRTGKHRRGSRGRALRCRWRPDAARLTQGTPRVPDGADVRPAGLMIVRRTGVVANSGGRRGWVESAGPERTNE